MNQSVYDILRRRYPANEYALMAEVRDAAGFHASNSADYILMNLWPSRGLHLSGIELKSGRGDWLSELKKPHKQEAIFQFCDFFWLLTANDTVAKLEEIPVTWGWMNIKGEKIFMMKDAPKLVPEPIDRSFLAALLKRATDKTNFVHIDSIADKISEAKGRGRDEAQWEIKNLKEKFEDLNKQLQKFEEVSGIKIERWGDNTKIGQAVKAIMDAGPEKIRRDLLNLEETSRKIHERIAKSLKSLPDTAQLEISSQS